MKGAARRLRLLCVGEAGVDFLANSYWSTGLFQRLADRLRVMRLIAARAFERGNRARLKRLIGQELRVALRRGESVRLVIGN